MASTASLVYDYLDGELDEHSAKVFEDLLHDDAAAIDDLVVSSFIHSQLIDLMGRRRVQIKAVGDSFGENALLTPANWRASSADWLAGPRQPISPVTEGSIKGQPSRRSWLRSLIGIAAMLVVTATILLAYRSYSRAVYVAQLSRSANCQWQIPNDNLPSGTLLEAGQVLDLVVGRALVTFTSGAQVVLEGPTTIRLDSATAAEMSRGRITTMVPSQAIGFTITTPIARFVDLGTEFAVKLDGGKVFVLHVFDGLVEVQLPERADQSAPKPLRISELSAVRYDAESDQVSSEPYDTNERMSL